MMRRHHSDRPRLLLVDDDPTYCSVLSGALEDRGFDVKAALYGSAGVQLIDSWTPQFAVFDLRLPDMSGLNLVARLNEVATDARIVVLTGYGSITTAIDAIKLGAVYYLTKPANADQILAAFDARCPDPGSAPTTRPVSVSRLEWEHIQRVLVDMDGNISAAARAMNMHRRTLQRKLNKNPPRD